MTKETFPSRKVRLFMLFWRVLWFFAMPFILLYLWRRGRGDALYPKHLSERFGFHKSRSQDHVWIHAVSIGELRSAVPLIRQLLNAGEHVVTTHFTPVGRRAAQDVFDNEIAAGQLSAVWVPFDYGQAFNRFFKAFHPKYGLVMEVEFWPGMIMAARRARIPLFLCNGQYPTRSFERDRVKRLSRADIVPGFAGVMVKSQRQADRFASLGVKNIEITGELRFEQPIPKAQVAAGVAAKQAMQNGRPVIGLASVVDGEDQLFMDAMKAARWPQKPLFVYVPRAPERFEITRELLQKAGLKVESRSQVFGADFDLKVNLDDYEVLLGDSLGEMFFYLSICDKVLVGGGFTNKGSHNISEPLALGKPVIVGPEIWTIEYPVVEAMDAGVCVMSSKATLAQDLAAPSGTTTEDIQTFMAAQCGAVARTQAAIARLLAATSR